MKSAFKRSFTIFCLVLALSNTGAYAAIGRDNNSRFPWLDRLEQWAVRILGDVLVLPKG